MSRSELKVSLLSGSISCSFFSPSSRNFIVQRESSSSSSSDSSTTSGWFFAASSASAARRARLSSSFLFLAAFAIRYLFRSIHLSIQSLPTTNGAMLTTRLSFATTKADSSPSGLNPMLFSMLKHAAWRAILAAMTLLPRLTLRNLTSNGLWITLFISERRIRALSSAIAIPLSSSPMLETNSLSSLPIRFCSLSLAEKLNDDAAANFSNFPLKSL
mmetsp:Transcript_11182/g.26111  ORF Transcript_11182/g.26111 Transcript_11182/m.26111 type:complete len:216 (-) Transcript_11182:1298-1945(-)